MTNEASYSIDVSIIVTLHSEGILAYKTLRNIEESIDRAKANNISCEVLLGLDNADELTIKIAHNFKEKSSNKHCSIFESNYKDSGLNRNNLIDKSKGKYIVIHDGDDFFTQNFIIEAFKKSQKTTYDAVFVPQILVNFEAQHYMTKYIPSNSAEVSKSFFFETNYYTSQYFIPRGLLEELCYESSSDGYGYEDWWLTTMLLSRGVEFIPVKNTAFYYRRKKAGSLLSQENLDSVLLRKTNLFEPRNYLKLRQKNKENLVGTEVCETKPLSLSSSIANLIERVRSINAYKTDLPSVVMRSLIAGLLLVEKNINLVKVHFDNKNKQIIEKPFEQEEHIASIIKRNSRQVPPRMQEIGVSQTLINEWGKLNSIEPMIRASWDMFEYIPIVSYPVESNLSKAYYKFCKLFADEKFTDIVFVPHMVRGGAELATIHLVRSLCALGKKVLVVSSLDTESVWAYRIKEIEGAKYIENKKLLKNVPDEQARMLFWIRVMQYWNIERATTINSEFGYKIFSKYRRQLADMECSCYVHTYAFDITEDGFIFNYIPNGLVDLYGAVNKYVTDSQQYNNMIKTINGFTVDDVQTLYLPVDATKLTPKTNYSRQNKVIYAARICSQKIANVAVEVGRLLGEKGIELHFYGNIDPEYAYNDRFLTMINDIPSIKYKGSFEAFGKLPLNEYDMYLLTTRTEGLANVILEACLSNIYVVSAAVGGLPECITDGRNGYLVPDTIEKFNPQAYVDAIMSAYESKACFDQNMIRDENSRIAQRHSQANYSDRVKSIMSLD